jgi:hypothetical protein
MRIRSLFDPGSGMEKFGSGINIPDPPHWNKVLKKRKNYKNYHVNCREK